MSIDTRRAPPPPPPPKPKPKPVVHHDAPKVAAQHADAKKTTASKETQAASRGRAQRDERHAAQRVHAVPEKTKVDDAKRAIQKNADAVAHAPNERAKRDAVLKATHDLPRILESVAPSDRKGVLEAAQPALHTIARGIDPLSRDETQRAVGDLGNAANVAGNENATLVARPLATEMKSIEAGNKRNFDEVNAALVANTKEGRGSLLGAAVVHEVSAYGDVKDANTLALNQRQALKDVRNDYDDAKKKADHLDPVLANQVNAWKGTLTPDELQAGVERFQKDHAADYAKRDVAAKLVATTLPGAGYSADHPVERAGLVEQSALVDESKQQLATVPSIATTPSGSRAVSDALAQDSRGQRTFLDAAKANATTPAQKDQFENAILRSVAVRGDELARGQQLDQVPALIRGAAGLVDDPGLKKTLDSYSGDVAHIASQGLPPEKAARSLLTASTAALNQAPKLGATGESAAKFAAVARSLGIGAVALAGVNFANDPSVRTGLETLSSALPAGVAFTEGATRALLSKAGLAATVAFSAFDTVSALQRGDVGGAALAAAPAAGAAIGAGVGVWAFGVGAVPGAIIGGAIGTVVSVGGKLLGIGQHDPVVDYEKESEPFLKGALGKAGLPEDASFRLRDVDGDLVEVGGVFPPLAKRLGVTPHELLARVSRLSDGDRHDFVKAALGVDNNSNAIKDAAKNHATAPALAFDGGDVDALAGRVRSDWPQLSG